MKYIYIYTAAGRQPSKARMTMNCGFFYQGLSPMNVRYLYAALFLLANVVAWFSRENHSSYFLNQRVGGCQGDRDCYAAESVLATSHAFFVSYS
jgi:serine incorporator 1/3